MSCIVRSHLKQIKVQMLSSPFKQLKAKAIKELQNHHHGDDLFQKSLLALEQKTAWSQALSPVSSPKLLSNFVLLFKLHLFMSHTCVCARTCAQVSLTLVLPLYHVVPGDQTQVVKLDGKCSNPLSHLTGPWFLEVEWGRGLNPGPRSAPQDQGFCGSYISVYPSFSPPLLARPWLPTLDKPSPS